MLEIKGKVNTALCFAKVVEDDAIEQVRTMCDCEFTEGSRIRIMPDVHAGKGCTIETAMTVEGKAVPNVVGVDIGCGMYTVNLGKNDIDFEKVDEAALFIPSGRNVWDGRQEHFDLTGLRCYRNLKDARKQERAIGTLGGGNHFIEIEKLLAIKAELNEKEERPKTVLFNDFIEDRIRYLERIAPAIPENRMAWDKLDDLFRSVVNNNIWHIH